MRCTKRPIRFDVQVSAWVASKTKRGKDDEKAFNDLSSSSARYHVRDSGVAGLTGMGRTAPEAQANTAQTQVNPELIAKLQEASEEAVREGRNGNKNNAEFVLKNVQINDLIERLKSGHKVDPSEIDQTLEPARVW